MNDLIFKEQELEEMYKAKIIEPLTDMLDIEEVAMKIKKLNNKKDFYKKLKKKRNKDIDNLIERTDGKVTFFRSVILKTLQTNEEKTLSFPGVCEVGDRKGGVVFSIIDQDKLFEYLKENDKFDDFVKVEEKVQTKDIKKFFTELDKNSGLPKCVKKEVGDNILSLKFNKDIDISIKEQELKVDYDQDMDNDDFDQLNI